MFSGGYHGIVCNLVGASFSGNPGKINIMFYPVVIAHHDVYQVFVDGGT